MPESTPHEQIFQRMLTAAPRLRATSSKERSEKLRRLEKNLLSLRDEIAESLREDFGKPYEEVLLTEISPVVIEIRHAVRELRKWMKPHRVGSPRALSGTRSWIQYESKGPSLIISPWNYAFTLTLGPIISAVAAGCPVVVKPSEFTPTATDLLSRLIGDTFDDDEVVIYPGTREVARELLKLPFRHVYFTGSPRVGKIVMAAASEHLASVTLELGGKSPGIVDRSADLQSTARRIAFGKFTNGGQTCIAPDYLLVHEAVVDELQDHVIQAINDLYGTDTHAQAPPRDLSRMISIPHAERIIRLLEDAKKGGAEVIYGGSHLRDSKFVEPTLLRNVSANSRLMQEEIFGPILPILTFSSQQEIQEILNGFDPPLSLYLFSKDQAFEQYVLETVEAGCISINETLLHFSNPELPFGGLASSGVGRGHGFSGFLAFSNQKGVFKQPLGTWLMSNLHPPFGKNTLRWIRTVIRFS